MNSLQVTQTDTHGNLLAGKNALETRENPFKEFKENFGHCCSGSDQRVNPLHIVAIATFAISLAIGARFLAAHFGSDLSIKSFPFSGAVIVGAGTSFIGMAALNTLHNRRVRKRNPTAIKINTAHMLMINALAVICALGTFYATQAVGINTRLPVIKISGAVLVGAAVNLTGLYLLNCTHRKRTEKRLKQAAPKPQPPTAPPEEPIYTGL